MADGTSRSDFGGTGRKQDSHDAGAENAADDGFEVHVLARCLVEIRIGYVFSCRAWPVILWAWAVAHHPDVRPNKGFAGFARRHPGVGSVR